MLTGDLPRQPFGIMVLSFAFVVTVTGCQRPRAAIGCQTGADARRYRRCGQDPAAEPATVPGASKISPAALIHSFTHCPEAPSRVGWEGSRWRGIGRLCRTPAAGAELNSGQQVSGMRSRISWRWAVLIGLALALPASSTLASAGHMTAKPRPSPGAAIAAGSAVTAANIMASVPAVQVARFFEVGYTVADLPAAMTQFTDALGIQWGPVRGSTLNIRLENGQVKPMFLQAVVSVQGPPYIELVQGVHGMGENPWKATPDFSPAHFGYAVHNLAARGFLTQPSLS